MSPTFFTTGNKKIILSRKWFLGFLLFCAIVCTIPTIINHVFDQQNSFDCYDCTFNRLNDRNTWNAWKPKPGDKELKTPVQRVIATYTADEWESCTTRVRIFFNILSSS